MIAQNQLTLLHRFVILGGGIILARTAQTAPDLVTLRLVFFLVDAVRNAGSIGFDLRRLTLQCFNHTLGLRMAVLFGLCGQRQRLLDIGRLHRLLGIQIEGFGHAGLGFIACSLGGGTIADELKRLLVLIPSQLVVASSQSFTRGLQRGEAVAIERLAADGLQRHQFRYQAGSVTVLLRDSRSGRRGGRSGLSRRCGRRFCRRCRRRLCRRGRCGLFLSLGLCCGSRSRGGFFLGLRLCRRGRRGLFFSFRFRCRCGRGRRRRFGGFGLRLGRRLCGWSRRLRRRRFLTLPTQILQQRFEIILRVQAGHGSTSHGRNTQH